MAKDKRRSAKVGKEKRKKYFWISQMLLMKFDTKGLNQIERNRASHCSSSFSECRNS